MDTSLTLELSKTDSLLKKFDEIHNFIYSNDGLSTQQTLEEFIKILFIKIYAENNNSNEFHISTEELNEIKTGKKESIFTERINNLFLNTKKEFHTVFEIDERIRLSSISLAYSVNKLQLISLNRSSNDVKGLAFQKFLAHQEKVGRGQFFTPEPIINLCVEIIQPSADEIIIDPACGSGGFLISSLNYIRKNNKSVDSRKIISNNLFGLDINKSIARIAKMKLILESNGSSNIHCVNSLDDIDELKLMFSDTFNNNAFDGFDIVLTNPPFGTVGKITSIKTLSQYDLGYKWTGVGDKYYKTKNICNGQTAEILFIERCLQFLKEGGRLGIVLPNGLFENPSLEYLRYYIKQKAVILAIINLPQETFIPYGTGVKTSLLFLKKVSDHNNFNYKIFFSKIQKIGYQGNKNGTPIYQKDKYGTILKNEKNEPVLDEDMSNTIKDYKMFKEKDIIKSSNSFTIIINELNGRFDYDYYSPTNRGLITILEKRNAVKLSSIADIIKAKSPILNMSDKIVGYVELSDINTHSFEIINSTLYLVHELPSRASYEMKNGDIITAVAGNSVGMNKHATALVTEEFENCICTNGFRVLRNFKINPYYLLYFLRSDYFLKQMYMYRTGAAIPSVSDYDLSNILVDLPDENTIEVISMKVKKAFELRKESRAILESIQFNGN